MPFTCFYNNEHKNSVVCKRFSSSVQTIDFNFVKFASNTRHYFEKLSTSTPFWQSNSGTNLKCLTNNYFNDFATFV